RAASAALPNGQAPPLLVIGYREPSIVFTEGTVTLLRQGVEGGAAAVTGQRALVEVRQRAAFEDSLSARGLEFQPEGAPVAGRNYSNGDDVSLQPGRVTAARN
ncbi:MAG: hypothetical protein SGJ23_07630, partial [Alphaproteobacteria bacterium]|nr:hypothetical protein [Alphaproteobacteria bacterium]